MANKMKAIWDKHEKRDLEAPEREAAQAASQEQHADDANEKRSTPVIVTVNTDGRRVITYAK